MKVLLLNPNIFPKDVDGKFFPIGLGYIATVVKNAGYDLTILDLEAHPMSEEQFGIYLSRSKFDLIGLGTMITMYQWTKWAISVIREKQPHSIIVLGNTIAATNPELLFAKMPIDIAVIGEGEATILDILNKMERAESFEEVTGIVFRNKKGEIIINPRREPIEDLDRLPFVNRDLFDIEEYIRTSKNTINNPLPMPVEKIRALNINTARGCVNSCTFCLPKFLRKKYKSRSEESIVKEMKELQQKYDINYIQFTSLLNFTDKKHVERFCDKMLAEDLFMYWAGSVASTLFSDPDPQNRLIAQKMKKTGCVWLGMSIESVNKEIRKAMNRPSSLENFLNTRKVLLDVKIATISSLIFGYPQETEDTIQETIDFCIREHMAPGTGFLQPLPGTPMYNYAMANGYIKNEEEYFLQMGSFREIHINMTRMSDDELVESVRRSVKRMQDEVMGSDLHFEDPIKTGRYLSADEI